jgi:hypothetical protein
MLENKFFPTTRLHFPENLLQRQDNDDALVFCAEEKRGNVLSGKSCMMRYHGYGRR